VLQAQGAILVDVKLPNTGQYRASELEVLLYEGRAVVRRRGVERTGADRHGLRLRAGDAAPACADFSGFGQRKTVAA
jgi:hypothetical protein